MKLTYEQKVDIYYRHTKGVSIRALAIEYNVNLSLLKYMIRLIKAHGLHIIEHTYTQYSDEDKLNAINRVLLNNESITSVAVDICLSSPHSLREWIKSFIENDYNVVTKKKGRPRSSVEEKEDSRRTGNGNPATSPTEFEAYNRKRIHKKIRCLNYRTRNARREEMTRAVTELRQELNCSLRFILDTINSNDSLPHLAKSDYYYWSKRVDPDTKYSELIDEIKSIHSRHHNRYGYRRITLELNSDGWKVNHKTVKRLMSKLGLYGITPRAKYRSYKGDFNGVVDNILLHKCVNTKKHTTTYIRDFTTSRVNEKWTTDISEFHIAAGKLYLSPILDMHNREIVSYNISRSPNFYQITDMLNKAFKKHPKLNNLIFHSDQGWQYQMTQYHAALRERGIKQSMSRKGNCLDNSPMENFFGKMKNEMFYGHEFEFESLDQLQRAMEEYIDYYNNKRIQVKLKGLTPCQARSQSLYSSH